MEVINRIMAYNILIPVVIVISGILTGFLIESLFKYKLLKMAKRSKFITDDIIVGAFKGMFLLWFSAAGAYFSLLWAFGDKSWMTQVLKIFIVITIAAVTIIVMRIATGIVKAYSKKAEGILPSTSIFANLTKLLVLVVGILFILKYLDVSITPILTALGIGGLAVALALQDTLSNTFAGIHILLSRQIRPGDYIRLDSGEEGFVTDICWRNTSLRMMSNNLILIPNSKLSNAIVTNYELPDREMSVLLNVGVSYSSDLEKVEGIVSDVGSEVMKEVSGGVPEFVPFIRFHTFSDSSIDFTVILRAKSFSDQYIIKHEFIKRLHKRFDAEGIEIPFPIRTIHLKHGR